MAAGYNFAFQMSLQAPPDADVKQVRRTIEAGLKGIKVQLDTKGMKQASTQIDKVGKASDKAQKKAEGFADTVTLKGRSFAAYTVASAGIIKLTGAITNATREAIKLEKEFAKIAQVTGQSNAQIKANAGAILDISKNFGIASNKVAELTRLLTQTGMSFREAAKGAEILARTELLASFDNLQKTTEGLIALMSSFRLSIDDANKGLEAINVVSKRFAVESGDIVEAIKRTGGAFSAAGGNINELIALFTSVRSTSRESAETIATAFRTIFGRLQRPKTIEYFKELNIQLADAQGNFVGGYEAVRRISKGLKEAGITAGSIKFAEVAEQMGGIRQISKVIPLLTQFEKSQKALAIANQGTVESDKDVAKAKQTLSYQIAALTQNFRALLYEITQTTSFKLIAQIFIDGANAAISLARALKPLIPLLATIAGFKLARGMFGALKGLKSGRLNPAAMASGGVVPGKGNRDTVPAMLTPGEFVIRKSAVEAFGAGNLSKINKYALGGSVTIQDDIGQIAPRGKAGISKSSNKTMTIGALRKKMGKKVLPRWKGTDTVNIDRTAVKESVLDGKNTFKEGAFVNNVVGPINAEIKRQVKERTGVSKNVAGIKGDKKAMESLGGFAFERYAGAILGLAPGGGGTPFDFRSTDKRTLSKLQGISKNDPLPDFLDAKRAFVGPGQIVDKGLRDSKVKKTVNERKRRKAASAKARMRKAAGGSISGTDTVPALLTPGEFVVNRASAQAVGYGNLRKINKYAKGGVVQRFQDGGLAKSSGAGARRQEMKVGGLGALEGEIQMLTKWIKGFQDSTKKLIDEEQGLANQTSKLAKNETKLANSHTRYLKRQNKLIAQAKTTGEKDKLKADLATKSAKHEKNMASLTKKRVQLTQKRDKITTQVMKDEKYLADTTRMRGDAMKKAGKMKGQMKGADQATAKRGIEHGPPRPQPEIKTDKANKSLKKLEKSSSQTARRLKKGLGGLNFMNLMMGAQVAMTALQFFGVEVNQAAMGARGAFAATYAGTKILGDQLAKQGPKLEALGKNMKGMPKGGGWDKAMKGRDVAMRKASGKTAEVLAKTGKGMATAGKALSKALNLPLLGLEILSIGIEIMATTPFKKLRDEAIKNGAVQKAGTMAVKAFNKDVLGTVPILGGFLNAIDELTGGVIGASYVWLIGAEAMQTASKSSAELAATLSTSGKILEENFKDVAKAQKSGIDTGNWDEFNNIMTGAIGNTLDNIGTRADTVATDVAEMGAGLGPALKASMASAAVAGGVGTLVGTPLVGGIAAGVAGITTFTLMMMSAGTIAREGSKLAQEAYKQQGEGMRQAIEMTGTGMRHLAKELIMAGHSSEEVAAIMQKKLGPSMDRFGVITDAAGAEEAEKQMKEAQQKGEQAKRQRVTESGHWVGTTRKVARRDMEIEQQAQIEATAKKKLEEYEAYKQTKKAAEENRKELEIMSKTYLAQARAIRHLKEEVGEFNKKVMDADLAEEMVGTVGKTSGAKELRRRMGTDVFQGSLEEISQRPGAMGRLRNQAERFVGPEAGRQVQQAVDLKTGLDAMLKNEGNKFGKALDEFNQDIAATSLGTDAMKEMGTKFLKEQVFGGNIPKQFAGIVDGLSLEVAKAVREKDPSKLASLLQEKLGHLSEEALKTLQKTLTEQAERTSKYGTMLMQLTDMELKFAKARLDQARKANEALEKLENERISTLESAGIDKKQLRVARRENVREGVQRARQDFGVTGAGGFRARSGDLRARLATQGGPGGTGRIAQTAEGALGAMEDQAAADKARKETIQGLKNMNEGLKKEMSAKKALLKITIEEANERRKNMQAFNDAVGDIVTEFAFGSDEARMDLMEGAALTQAALQQGGIQGMTGEQRGAVGGFLDRFAGVDMGLAAFGGKKASEVKGQFAAQEAARMGLIRPDEIDKFAKAAAKEAVPVEEKIQKKINATYDSIKKDQDEINKNEKAIVDDQGKHIQEFKDAVGEFKKATARFFEQNLEERGMKEFDRQVSDIRPEQEELKRLKDEEATHKKKAMDAEDIVAKREKAAYGGMTSAQLQKEEEALRAKKTAGTATEEEAARHQMLMNKRISGGRFLGQDKEYKENLAIAKEARAEEKKYQDQRIAQEKKVGKMKEDAGLTGLDVTDKAAVAKARGAAGVEYRTRVQGETAALEAPGGPSGALVQGVGTAVQTGRQMGGAGVQALLDAGLISQEDAKYFQNLMGAGGGGGAGGGAPAQVDPSNPWFNPNDPMMQTGFGMPGPGPVTQNQLSQLPGMVPPDRDMIEHPAAQQLDVNMAPTQIDIGLGQLAGIVTDTLQSSLLGLVGQSLVDTATEMGVPTDAAGIAESIRTVGTRIMEGAAGGATQQAGGKK